MLGLHNRRPLFFVPDEGRVHVYEQGRAGTLRVTELDPHDAACLSREHPAVKVYVGLDVERI
jgi:hypothetical protein